MKSSVIYSAVIATALLGSATAFAAEDAGARFTATLDGASEVTAQGGDPDGMGTATVRVNPGRNQVCFSISVTGISTATVTHIHKGAAGVSGPVVVDLVAPVNGISQGCTAMVDRELAKEIIKNPADYYVNVHSTEFRAGAVRGQLGR